MANVDHKQDFTLEYSIEDVTVGLKEAFDCKLSNKGIKVEKYDENLNTFFLKAGVTAFSWGEKITVVLKAEQNGYTTVEITSAPKTGAMFGGMMDMGKNRKNINLIMQSISEQLDGKEKVSVNTTHTVVKDPYEELKKAKELLDIGVLTKEEFEAKKKQLLDL